MVLYWNSGSTYSRLRGLSQRNIRKTNHITRPYAVDTVDNQDNQDSWKV
jgi:hypothetical protein